MDKRSAMIIAGTLVVALMSGVVAREVSLVPSGAGADPDRADVDGSCRAGRPGPGRRDR